MPEKSSPNDIEALFAEVKGELQTTKAAVTSADEKNKARLGRDRSWISISVILTYALAILAIFVYITFSVPACETTTCPNAITTWEKQADLLHNLFITAVLPVVTLMIGFYFGTEKNNQDNA